jgi:hypothetical protein
VAMGWMQILRRLQSQDALPISLLPSASQLPSCFSPRNEIREAGRKRRYAPKPCGRGEQRTKRSGKPRSGKSFWLARILRNRVIRKGPQKGLVDRGKSGRKLKGGGSWKERISSPGWQ